VQAEVQFALDKAVGFTGTSEADIVAAYSALTAAATNVLTTDPQIASAFSIDKANVGVTTVSAPTVTAPPQATPQPSRPTQVTPEPLPASAPALSAMLTLLFAIALALLL